MSDQTVDQMSGPASFTSRMADALLRNLGGRTVLLHIPAPAVNDDPGEQLGLAVPQFQDIELGPVALRRLRSKTAPLTATAYELLVSASAVRGIVGSLGFDAAEVLFNTAAGILVGQTLLAITWVAGVEAFGSVYLYRLGLRGPNADIT